MGIRPLGAHLGAHMVQMPTAGQGPLHGWPSENGVTPLHPQSVCVHPPGPAGAPAGVPPTTPHRDQPYRFLRRFSSFSSVMTIRAPVQPRGWPRATAPPRGFTFSGGMPNFSTQ